MIFRLAFTSFYFVFSRFYSFSNSPSGDVIIRPRCARFLKALKTFAAEKPSVTT